MNIHCSNFLGIDKDGFSEKFKKYGDPNKNLVITGVIIVLVAMVVSFIILKKKNEGITPEYLKNFPANTNFYIDSDLSESKIKDINRLTKLNVKSLPDIFNKIFEDKYNNLNHKKIVFLMSKSFNNSFCFGSWNDVETNGNKEKNLAIFTIKREKMILPLFKALTDNKIAVQTFKGFNITYSPDKNLAFLIYRNRLYLADSVNTMKIVVKNHLINNSSNFYKNNDVRESVEHLKKNRIATVILSNYNFDNDSFKNNLGNLKQITKSVGSTAIEVLTDKNKIYFNSYTPIDLSKIENTKARDSFKVILNSKADNFYPRFLPENTKAFIYINNLKNYFDLVCELNGWKESGQYNQAKQLIKMLTSLDFENDILQAFSNGITITSVNTGNIEPSYAAILKNDANSEKIFSQLVKLAQIQLPSAKIGKVIYKNNELNLISAPALPVKICFGPVGKNLYAFGDKQTVQVLVDTMDKNNINLANLKEYNLLEEHNLNKPKFIMYLNTKDLNEVKNRSILADKKFIIEKLQNRVKGILFCVNVKNNIIESSLQLALK